ncbi:MAG: Nif3-like dinuclear metal center hexameric protein [Flavobacteriia bacterium]|nr:Nif3-like dinuclear metal center hexameric protein [Flavobacteriia bacterium]OIP48365.1 MAG: Nif3-like dinuclear metal center hexameric protein [Flavobacteriaceae bacterium CG2_30_31_66]PIV96310.1 MAG: Nif3-like dinuclear metal center hexameric protein [Flavobacteriaceae bacterium CG17_big_fil_post_rev_8_21_14_2_50_31_13]PIX13185.1 MAG: Nif3-like dinuclear metal center hexameric protein [Flavobacteriaceae bacterium CG_4_8_14_3_um_filter_31_8]PIY13572.1 MAG: Nif3-like dinuclear metal center h
MKVKEVTSILEEIAPLNYAEDFDNVGLLIGNNQTEVIGVLVALDTLETTIDEAIEKKCNLIISFHPIIFNGLKKLNGNNYVEKVVIKAIQNNIAIYAIHTALDNSFEGVSAKIAEVLDLQNTKVLIPKKNILKKLTTYIPTHAAIQLRNTLFDAGAGNIGNYDNCSFSISGEGTFRGNEKSNPTLGEKSKLHLEKEIQISVLFEVKNEENILKALHENHPYEEVSYEIITIENSYQNVGMGIIGDLSKPLYEKDFLEYLKKTMKTDCIRHSAYINRKIKKVAVLGGSGSFAISTAKKLGADAYVSADFKYHDFFKAENNILLADIGHYESEQFTKNLIVDFLTKKISNFAIILSEKNTNPIYYL